MRTSQKLVSKVLFQSSSKTKSLAFQDTLFKLNAPSTAGAPVGWVVWGRCDFRIFLGRGDDVQCCAQCSACGCSEKDDILYIVYIAYL